MPVSEIGEDDDVVKIKLAGDTIKVYEDYDIRTSVLTQPAAFAMRLGGRDADYQSSVDRSSNNSLKSMIAAYPPKTSFQLYIGETLIQTGETDGYEASDGSGATQFTVRGRDALAPLHDGYVEAENSYSNSTYLQIVKSALKQVGLSKATLVTSNEANRKAVTNGKASQTGAPSNKLATTGPDPITRTIYVKIGERWYEFVKRILDRAGLFLWAAADGTFVLSEPNAKQSPTYTLIRQRDATRDQVNVLSVRYRNETTGRFSACSVYTRGGGRKFGAAKSKGGEVDEEMTNLGYVRPLVVRDVNANTKQQASFYALRKLAESRRQGWNLTYVVAGHTFPTASGERIPWFVDTIVQVQDEELGLSGPYWIESVTFRRNPQTTTELVLQRPADLIFGSDEF